MNDDGSEQPEDISTPDIEVKDTNDENSDAPIIPSNVRPTRRATIEAKKKMKQWLNPVEQAFICLGSVAVNARTRSSD